MSWIDIIKKLSTSTTPTVSAAPPTFDTSIGGQFATANELHNNPNPQAVPTDYTGFNTPALTKSNPLTPTISNGYWKVDVPDTAPAFTAPPLFPSGTTFNPLTMKLDMPGVPEGYKYDPITSKAIAPPNAPINAPVTPLKSTITNSSIRYDTPVPPHVEDSFDLTRQQATAAGEQERKDLADAISRRAAAQGWGENSGMLEKRLNIGDVEARKALASRLGGIDVAEAQSKESVQTDKDRELRNAEMKSVYNIGQAGGELTPEQKSNPVLVAAYEDGKAGRDLKLEERDFNSVTGLRNALALNIDPATDPNYAQHLSDLFNWAGSFNSEGGSGQLPPLPLSVTTPAPINNFSTSGFWNTNDGTNRDSFNSDPPPVGNSIQINGKKYKVTSGIKFQDVWGLDNFDYFTVQGEDGKTYAVVPSGVGPTDAKTLGLPLVP